MQSQKTRIIFCHYGDSPYLYFTLRCARLSNPQSRIILLGDAANKKIATSAGVEHFYFDDFNNSGEILEFERVYHHVAGQKHGRKFWTKFVFKRWFFVHEFIKKQRINSFWHFDSDNMILTDLNKQEYKFVNYDCTEMCNGICMNGFISSFNVVDGYVKKINQLFLDEDYLKHQGKDFIKHPNYAFTEMRAYKTYKEQEHINSIRLNSIISYETFDERLCQAQGYETYANPLNNRYYKKLYLDKNGFLFCYHLSSKNYIKMNSLDLSWVPNNLFRKLKVAIKSTSGKDSLSDERNDFMLLDIHSFSFKERFMETINKVQNKLRTMFKSH